jgi:transcriptional regulator with XRE-family HTH domain
VVLAGLVGRSESWLSQVERGKRSIDSHSVLSRLAEVLRVDIEELTDPQNGDENSRGVYPAVALIERSMMGYGISGQDEHAHQPDPAYLRATADSAYRSYQETRYDTTGRILPGLIRDTEAAACLKGSASAEVWQVRARVYDTAAALLSRVGEPLLAWAAADRARAAAEYFGDPLLVAASSWRLSYMVTGRKHPRQALELATTAAAALDGAMRGPSRRALRACR